MVKSQQHIAQAMARNTKPTITTAMQKLNNAPDWACVPLPKPLDQLSTLTYLHSINTKKATANKKLKTATRATHTKHKSNHFNKLIT